MYTVNATVAFAFVKFNKRLLMLFRKKYDPPLIDQADLKLLPSTIVWAVPYVFNYTTLTLPRSLEIWTRTWKVSTTQLFQFPSTIQDTSTISTRESGPGCSLETDDGQSAATPLSEALHQHRQSMSSAPDVGRGAGGNTLNGTVALRITQHPIH